MIDNQAYGSFHEHAMEFVSDFADSQDHRRVADLIFQLLTENMDLDIQHQDHPFDKYANPNMSRDDICANLRVDCLARMHEETQFTRSLVRAFCSPNGAYRECLNQLLDDYNVFVQLCQ
jgi:hypothetical protein